MLVIAASAEGEEVLVTLPDSSALSPGSQSKTATLRIEDVQGTYTIPFIQSERDLHVRVDFGDPAIVVAQMRLLHDDRLVAERCLARKQASTVFSGLAPGEYSLDCRGVDGDGGQRCRVSCVRLGIGVVIAALGDSITEGYFSHGYQRDDLNLAAACFPAESVSHDGRQFPQFSPTTNRHLPHVNCFESWMTPLNNRLTVAWRQPVFLANEGWGGITTERYLAMMRSDPGWKKRMGRLAPTIWLIHLGVNDERAATPAAVVRTHLAAMVDLLIHDYRAKPACIFLAIPSYDYAPGAAAILRSYTPLQKTGRSGTATIPCIRT